MSWEAVCDQAAGPVTLFDLQGQYLYVNPAFCRLIGYDRGEVFRRGRERLTHPDDRTRDRESIERIFTSADGPISLEKRFVCSDGSVIWVLVHLSAIKDADGSPKAFLSQIHEITDRRKSEKRWQETFANAPIGMALLDLEAQWTEVNDALCDLLGYKRDELLAMHPSELIYADEDKPPRTLLRPLVDGHQDSVSLERRYRHRDGYPLWVLIHVSLVRGPDGAPAYLIGQGEEIGNRRMADTHLAHLALHDPLTGLANRALLTDRLAQRLAELPRHGGTLAVLMVDLDGLKPVNDQYGHLTGDQLLIAAADELLGAVRAGDTVARFGGDEFVVVSDLEDSTAATALRERVAQCLDTEIEVPGQRVALRASVGLAITEEPGTQAEVLLHNADRDMYTRKWQQRSLHAHEQR